MCNGQSTATYPALAAVVGATVPDLRGEFIRGLDLGRGVDAGRFFGSSQGDAIRNITGSLGGGKICHGPISDGVFYQNFWGGVGSFNGNNSSGHFTGNWYFDASRVVPTADENRPRNIALLPCIKY